MNLGDTGMPLTLLRTMDLYPKRLKECKDLYEGAITDCDAIHSNCLYSSHIYPAKCVLGEDLYGEAFQAVRGFFPEFIGVLGSGELPSNFVAF
jgi:hypothetical protein